MAVVVLAKETQDFSTIQTTDHQWKAEVETRSLFKAGMEAVADLIIVETPDSQKINLAVEVDHKATAALEYFKSKN